MTLLNQYTGKVLAICAVRRSLDKADVNDGQAIMNWAKQNGIEP
jgi:predicted NUDIX family NTP pyrophosphohydrolase